MDQEYFGVKDVKSDTFQEIFPARSDSEAIRSFSMAITKPGNQVSEFAEDFSLYHLGKVDLDNGHMYGNENPRFVIHAITIKELHERKSQNVK